MVAWKNYPVLGPGCSIRRREGFHSTRVAATCPESPSRKDAAPGVDELLAALLARHAGVAPPYFTQSPSG